MALAAFNSAAFTAATGLAIAANATVEVRRESDSGLAAIYSDEAGTASITNPSAFVDSEGRFIFYVAASAGGYSIKVTKGAENWTLHNVAIGTAGQYDIDTFPVDSTPVPLDTKAIVKGSADDTKSLRIEVDGLTTATERVWTAPDADLTVVGEDTTQTLTNKTLTSPTLNTPTLNTPTAAIIESAAAGTPPVFEDNAAREMVQGCWAWVNFNGTGTVAIRDDFNVTSITDNGVGDYTVNLTNNLPNSNYSVCASGKTTASTSMGAAGAYSYSVSSFSVGCVSSAGSTTDVDFVCISVFCNP